MITGHETIAEMFKGLFRRPTAVEYAAKELAHAQLQQLRAAAEMAYYAKQHEFYAAVAAQMKQYLREAGADVDGRTTDGH